MIRPYNFTFHSFAIAASIAAICCGQPWVCLICSAFAENDEVVAVEDFIDVGNILGKSWVSLSAFNLYLKNPMVKCHIF